MNQDEDAAHVLALLKEHSLWITEQLEQHRIAGNLFGGFDFVQRLGQEMQLDMQKALRLYETYGFLRHLHFARRTNLKIRPGLTLEMIASWTPFDWVYNCFPLPASDVEVVTLAYVVDAMHEEVDQCTEWDSTPLGKVLHVAHMLVSHQDTDGLWPAVFNLRTGDSVGTERSSAPRHLMRRLNQILDSTEFDFALRRIEAGIVAQKG